MFWCIFFLTGMKRQVRWNFDEIMKQLSLAVTILSLTVQLHFVLCFQTGKIDFSWFRFVWFGRLPLISSWGVAHQLHLRAIVRGYLKCPLAPATTFRDVRTLLLLFCARYSWGDSLIGHLRSVVSTTWHNLQYHCRLSLKCHLSTATPVFRSLCVRVANQYAVQVVFWDTVRSADSNDTSKQVLTKICSFRVTVEFTFHVLLPYRNTEKTLTQNCASFILVFK